MRLSTVIKPKKLSDLLIRPEYQDQVAVFDWSALNEHKWPCLELMFGSLMGIHLSPRLLNKAKKSGMKAGKPDINLPFPMGGYIGLWIELKRSDGKKPTPAQIKCLRNLGAVGNATFSTRGSANAIKILTAYLENRIWRPVTLCVPGDPTKKLIL